MGEEKIGDDVEEDLWWESLEAVRGGLQRWHVAFLWHGVCVRIRKGCRRNGGKKYQG
jgi:hypothetical protein